MTPADVPARPTCGMSSTPSSPSFARAGSGGISPRTSRPRAPYGGSSTKGGTTAPWTLSTTCSAARSARRWASGSVGIGVGGHRGRWASGSVGIGVGGHRGRWASGSVGIGVGSGHGGQTDFGSGHRGHRGRHRGHRAGSLQGLLPGGRVAREHCCSPAPSERHVNLSVYAAQASPKAPRGTRWGVTHHLHDTGLGLTGVTRRRPHQQQAAVICSVSQASCSDGLVRRHPREVSPLSRGMISPGGSTPIRSITGRHSLPPSSSTRRPIGNPLAEGLPREEDDGLTTFHG